MSGKAPPYPRYPGDGGRGRFEAHWYCARTPPFEEKTTAPLPGGLVYTVWWFLVPERER